MTKYLLIAVLALSCVACEHLKNGLQVLQDPAIGELIRDLEQIVGIITQLTETPASTPEAQNAIQQSIDQQLDAARELIIQLEEQRAPKAAHRFEERLNTLTASEPQPPLELLE